MADKDNDETETETDDTLGDDEDFDPARFKQKLAKVNSEAQSLRQRLREAEAKAQKFDEQEEAKLSELERLQRELAEAKTKAEEEALKVLRLEVAADKQLPTGLAARLKGSSLEELEADAESLQADIEVLLQTSLEGQAGGQRLERKPDVRLKHRGEAGNKPTVTPEELLEKIRPT